MSDFRTEALRLVEAHGSRAVQIAVNQIVEAVRAGDDDRALDCDGILREVERIQQRAKLIPPGTEPVVCVPFTFLDLAPNKPKTSEGEQ